MSGPPEGWRSGSDTVKFFSDHGIVVHLSTITRHASKYELSQKHGRTVYIDAVALLEKYRTDYRGAMHAGELGGEKVSRLDAKPKIPGAVRDAAPAQEKPDEDEADRFSVPTDPTKRKAHYQALKLEREAAEAEGLLIPAVSAHAAITFAVAEAKTVHQAAMQPAAEKIAAMFKDDARSLEVRAILEDIYRAGWNAFAKAAAREMTNANPQALEDFGKLQAFADELRESRLDPDDRAANG
ncbi:MAG: hypothetical protein AAFW60_00300 [Pseudomonadota bacterium]